MSKIKNGVLDQYGAGPFEQQQFKTAGIDGVNTLKCIKCHFWWIFPIHRSYICAWIYESGIVMEKGEIAIGGKKKKNVHRQPGPLRGSSSPLSPIESARVVRPN